MDYDRYDAFLHHIFKQTQGDSWFRPHEDTPAAGVALRIDQPGSSSRLFAPTRVLTISPLPLLTLAAPLGSSTALVCVCGSLVSA